MSLSHFSVALVISIHAPLAGRDYGALCILHKLEGYFNPRAPCGARPFIHHQGISSEGFQSTRPLRGATARTPPTRSGSQISIHAPLAGRDFSSRKPRYDRGNFNPRAPCGARLEAPRLAGAHARDFNPRAPCGARRSSDPDGVHTVRISIHAPLAGRDRRRGVVYRDLAISIHAPLAGRDPHGVSDGVGPFGISIHAPLAGRDLFGSP